jgi:hypothetical protein
MECERGDKKWADCFTELFHGTFEIQIVDTLRSLETSTTTGFAAGRP